MSEQCISQRSTSDFSIARILSNDLSPYLKKGNKFEPCQEFIISKDRFEKESIILERKREENELEKIERLQTDGANLSSENLKNMKKDEQEILEIELPWLRCTRYSPPKLPRRSSSGKQTKRRLGSHPRIPFTKFQIQVLEEKYGSSAYLSRRDVIHLSGTLNLPQNRVKIWFQNRRARERRELQSDNLSLNT